MVALTMVLLFIFSLSARSENAELAAADAHRRSDPAYYPAEWTHGLTFCADAYMKNNEFLRTTKDTGLERLKFALDYAKKVSPSEPEEGCEAQPAIRGILASFFAKESQLPSILKAGGAVACDVKDQPAEERAELSRKGSASLADLEPLLENALTEARGAAPPKVKALIRGQRLLEGKTFDEFSSCDYDAWFEFGKLEELSCELYVTKTRFDYLVHEHEAGNYLAFQCFNDTPPEKEIGDGGPAHLPNQSDITGVGTHL